MVTLKDIARLAGVAPSTVSRIINDKADKSASEEVKNRVWAAVRDTGYIPNRAARQLRTGVQESEAPTISTLFARADGACEDSYFVELATYVSQEVLRQNCRLGPQYTLMQAQQWDPGGQEPGKADGLVILGKTGAHCNDFIAHFKKRVVYVTLNQAVLDRDHVACNGQLATETALQYLYDNGHRKIAYAGEQKNEIRFISYRAFLAKHGLTMERSLLMQVHMDREGGWRAAEMLLQMERACRPTAVFCANDATAVGLVKELEKRGARVPQEVSVISIDDIPAAAAMDPGLTTMKIPVNEMGSIAVKVLRDRIKKGHVAYLNVFVPSRLIVRDSVAPLL